MITEQDFEKKQIVFVFAKDGERVGLCNGNLLVKDENGKIKLQVSCFRLFIVYIIGHLSLTTPLIQEAKKYGFFFALYTPGFRFYDIIGGQKDGNTLLKAAQYEYHGIDIAKHIVKNKIAMQYQTLNEQREKSDYLKEVSERLKQYYGEIDAVENRESLLGYEGLASKSYFRAHFNNLAWQGRQPRVKRDWVNSTLDIGYTVLFSFVESLLCAFGFDTYVGVLHTQFYMRKSLTCDLVEPFRPVIDKTVRKCYNLREISEDDFLMKNGQYLLKWEKSPKYVSLFMKTLLSEKTAIFLYVRQYYRCFMKQSPVSAYPFYWKGGVAVGIDQL